MQKEVWRKINGYEGLYEVSNYGRVKSFKHKQKGHILSPGINSKGYKFVCLCKNNICKQFWVHRLVAEAFLENPENLPCVNHKDENPSNNFVKNLEWCSYKYNSNYGTGIERCRQKQLNDPERSTKIKCIDLKTKKISYYPSIAEAARVLGFYRGSIRRAMY